LKETAEAAAVAVDNAALDEEPWDVDVQLGMEKCDLYLEEAEEDMRRGLHRAMVW
jgi:hypothetical protein